MREALDKMVSFIIFIIAGLALAFIIPFFLVVGIVRFEDKLKSALLGMNKEAPNT